MLSPLLIELEELGESLGYEDFFEAMENLMAKVSPAERRLILKPKAQTSTKPSEHEASIASSSISRSRSGPSLYTRQLKAKQDAEERLRARQAK